MSNVVKFERARSERMSDYEYILTCGYTRIPNAVMRKLPQMNLTSMERRVLDAIMVKTIGFNKPADKVPLSQIADLMSSPEQTITKEKVSPILNALVAKRVIVREGSNQSPLRLNLDTEAWQRNTKATKAPESPNSSRNTEPSVKNDNSYRKTVTNSYRSSGTSKDRKDIISNPSDYLPELADETGQVADPTLPPESADGELPTPPPKKPKQDKHPVPFNEIVRLYHETLPDAPEFRVWNSTREGYIRARWNQRVGARHKPCNDLDFWRRFFGYVAESDFLCGRTDPAPGRKRFVADLEWLTKASNFAKVIEGKYHEEAGA